MSDKHLPPEALDAWLAAVSLELQLDPDATDTAALLRLAADVAHSVARPAAPLSTFLVGVALGAQQMGSRGEQGNDPASTRAALQALCDRVSARAATWNEQPET